METASIKKDIAKIIRIIDGDTIKVRLNNRAEVTVRMLLIDTPEIKHPKKLKEPYGEEASNFAKSKLKVNSYVYLEYEDYKLDMYNRVLAYLWYKEGLELKLYQEVILLEGLAKVSHSHYTQDKYLNLFLEAQYNAKMENKNLWSN